MTTKPILKQSTNVGIENYEEVGFKNADQFDGMIGDHGFKSYIDKAMKCPCTARQVGLSETGCMNCGGTGWFFIDRIEAKIMALGINSNKKNAAWSEENMGKASITVEHGNNLTFMDRFTLNELESVYSENLSFISKINQFFAFTIYEATEVINAYCFEGNDNKLRSLVNGRDFVIENNRLVMDKKFNPRASDTKPFTVSIRYKHHPVYHILDVKRDLQKSKFIAGDVEEKKYLPQNFICVKAHYILDADNMTKNRLLENTVLPST